MPKDRQEELRRLEKALLEIDQPHQEENPDLWLEDFFDQEDEEVHSVYNTDDTDVDLDEFSEEVHAGGRSGGCLVPIMLLLTLVLCALVGFVLWKLGVIG